MGKLRIGDVELQNSTILAPMAGVTDLPFRLLCKEQGAGLVCMEMVSAKALSFHNRNTEEMLTIHPEEVPVSLQLFGSDATIISEMAKAIEERPFAFLDINMGCPVPKVVNNKEGSALMLQPKLVEEILSKTVKAIRKPITVKIRKGFDDSCVNAVEIARIAEACGVAAITIHGRTRSQYYSGKADWDIIRQVKEAVCIPVIGNGDVIDAESAKRMLKETGCDGVMIGRAARGNPWIFGQIAAALDGMTVEEPSTSQIRAMMLHHMELQSSYKGEYTAIREMRKHVAWYTAGMPHSAAIRRRVNDIQSVEELRELIETM